MPDSSLMVRPQRVQKAALSSSNAVEDEPGEVAASIEAAQGMIERHLDRALMAQVHTDRLSRYDWTEQLRANENKWHTWAEVQPLVEVRSPDEVQKLSADRFLRDTVRPGPVEYVAGWRRKDQDKEDFGLSLTETPPVLPADIRRVGIELCLYLLNEAEHSAGMGSTEQAVGAGQTVTISGMDTGFINRKLSRLNGYKRA